MFARPLAVTRAGSVESIVIGCGVWVEVVKVGVDHDPSGRDGLRCRQMSKE